MPRVRENTEMIYSREKINGLSKKEIEALNDKARNGKLSDASVSILKEKKIDNEPIRKILNHK
jgi:hypothetical protein